MILACIVLRGSQCDRQALTYIQRQMGRESNSVVLGGGVVGGNCLSPGLPRHHVDPACSWRSTSDSVQMMAGTWSMIVMSGRHNDPSPVKRSSE